MQLTGLADGSAGVSDPCRGSAEVRVTYPGQTIYLMALVPLELIARVRKGAEGIHGEKSIKQT
jgi:hypothetical protein